METRVVIFKCGVTRAEVGGAGADIEFLHLFFNASVATSVEQLLPFDEFYFKKS